MPREPPHQLFVAEFAAAGQRLGKTAAALSLQAMVSAARSQTKAACRSDARMLEACGTADIKVASIRDSPKTGQRHAR